MPEQFIGAAIQPRVETMDASRLSAGEPTLPREFQWGAKTIQVVKVLRTWRETGPCLHGSGEQYVRKHWFEVQAASGGTMKIYFDRQPRPPGTMRRWWLFSIDSGTESPVSSRSL